MGRRRYSLRVSVGLEPEVFERLRTMTDKRGLSLSGMIRMTLKEWLRLREGGAASYGC